MEFPESLKWRSILLRAGIIATLCILLVHGYGKQWLLYYGNPIKGHVVDSASNNPVEGVLVAVMWDLIGCVSHGSDGYAKLCVTKTDKQGAFTIPAWISFKPWKIGSAVNDTAPYVLIYKPGYTVYWSNEPMRSGFSKDISSTATEKERAKRSSSLTPLRLNRINTVAELHDSMNLFSSEIPSYKYYSASQRETIFSAVEDGVLSLPCEIDNNVKAKILADIAAYRKYWIGGMK